MLVSLPCQSLIATVARKTDGVERGEREVEEGEREKDRQRQGEKWQREKEVEEKTDK